MIELIVVVVFLTVITMAAVPGFIASLRRAKFEKTVEEIVILLERARTQALASELDSNQKIPLGGYGIFIDFTSFILPALPTNQKAVLFIDDWNASMGLAVNVNYADEDIANRVLPDGKYTAGSDSELAVVEINDSKYIRIESLSGTRLADSTAWNHALDNEVIVIFKPPFAETKITGCNVANPDVDLQNFETKIKLVTEDISRTIKFNRVTTTPQVIEN